jgi:hypothetical protein
MDLNSAWDIVCWRGMTRLESAKYLGQPNLIKNMTAAVPTMPLPELDDMLIQ